MRGWGFASSLTMPLVAGGELVGLVDLYDDAERDWSPDLEFLTSVCQLVAGVFDSTALLDEAREIARLREELIELGADLAAAETPVDIAERAAARLRDAVGCADCDIWWLEEGYLRCLASVDGGGVDESVRGRILRLDHYPSTRQALEDREILVISSLDDDRLDRVRARGLRRVRLPQRVLDPARERRPGGRPDRRLRRARARLQRRALVPARGRRTVADALRNAELLAGLRRGNTALRELVELGDRLNEAGTLEELARAVADGCAPSSRRGLRHLAGGRRRAPLPRQHRQPRLGRRRGGIGATSSPPYQATVAALAANEPTSFGDLDATDLGEAEAEAYRRWGYRSMVSLPLVVDGRAIGLIDVFDTKVRDYTVHLDLIRNVGRLLAGSFEKAMLVERLEGGNQRPAAARGLGPGVRRDARRRRRAPHRRRSASSRSRTPTCATSTGRRRGRDPRRHRRGLGHGSARRSVPAGGLRHVPQGGGGAGRSAAPTSSPTPARPRRSRRRGSWATARASTSR